MDGRIKVSFGIKTSKQGSLQRKTATPNDDVEFISSFDGTCKPSRDEREVGELVIPSRANTMKGPAEVQSSEEQSKGREEEAAAAPSPPLSIDQMAAQELLKDAKGVMISGKKAVDVVPLPGDTQDDAAEASLEDYESVPVEDFGKAMLRGMGWEPGKGIGKNQRVVSPSSPQLRPKGLGLGADRAPSSGSLPREQQQGVEQATLAVGGGVQVIAGSHRGLYGRVVSRNEDTGRCIVKLEIGGSCASVNENCIKSVGKEEYASNCKVLRITKKISAEQREIMLQYMQEHPDFASGRIATPVGGVVKARMWEELAGKMNSCSTGTTKTPEKWSRSWQDWRSDVKAKAAKLRRSASMTGGGTSKVVPLTDMEEKLLAFIGETAVSGIPGNIEPMEIISVQPDGSISIPLTEEEGDGLMASPLTDTPTPPAKKRRVCEPDEYEDRGLHCNEQVADGIQRVAAGIEVLAKNSSEIKDLLKSLVETIGEVRDTCCQVQQVQGVVGSEASSRGWCMGSGGTVWREESEASVSVPT